MHFIGDTACLTKGLEAVTTYFPLSCSDDITVSTLPADAPYCLKITRGATPTIAYQKKHHFFRALSLYQQFVQEGKATFDYEEKALIATCGSMIDCSRNSVYRVEKLKELLVRFALMGQCTCMLYTEDTYEVPEYPYFGYFRGAYTQEELRTLDTFADNLGIELIPCIQTLAHLIQTLRWNYGQNIRDTNDVLLINEPETYTFIDALLKTIRETFRTKRIHIGMDEAFDLGRGRSLDTNGYKSHHELMRMHMQAVDTLLQKYDFEPMMWDDMFMRGDGPHAFHYDPTTPIPQATIASVPKNMSLVYWDYYHDTEEVYMQQFQKRQAFSNPVIFAGGVWKWMGYAPHYDKTFVTTNAGMHACKKYGIQEAFATLWGDDGDETPIDATMLGLILFTEHSYHETVSDEWLNDRCLALTGLDPAAFLALQNLDLIPGVPRPNSWCINPSKYLLYQDILMGAFDYYVKDLSLYSHYANLSDCYQDLATRNSTYAPMFTVYSQLANVLSLKANIGTDITEAYLKNDKEALHHLHDEMLPTLLSDLEAFKNSLRTLWYKDCKGNGYEILDIRIGGLISRCHTAMYRLSAYLDGEVTHLEELETPRLPFKMRYISDDNLPSYNLYYTLASQNIFGHGI